MPQRAARARIKPRPLRSLACSPPAPPVPQRTCAERSIAKFYFVVSIFGSANAQRARAQGLCSARQHVPWIWFNSAHNARRAARTPGAPARSVRRARDAIARLRLGDAQCAPAARQRTPFQRAPLSQIARHIAFERRTAQNHFWCTKSVRTSQVNTSEESILTCDIEFFTRVHSRSLALRARAQVLTNAHKCSQMLAIAHKRSQVTHNDGQTSARALK